MRRRLPIALNLVLATGLAWVLLGLPSAHTAGQQVVTIAAPAFVGLAKSTHNDGNPTPADACATQVPLTPGDEHFGDLNAAKGSFLAFVRFPQAVTVTRFSVLSNDFAGDDDTHAYLVRKRITPGTHPKETGYVTMANATSTGAEDSVIRKFNAPLIAHPKIDNTNFEYFAEIVICDATEPFAVQLVYTT
jgi:hypothetical protein